jgi:hypothetical protein
MFHFILSMFQNPEIHHLYQKARIQQESDKLGGDGRKSLGAACYPIVSTFAAVPAHWGLTTHASGTNAQKIISCCLHQSELMPSEQLIS